MNALLSQDHLDAIRTIITAVAQPTQDGPYWFDSISQQWVCVHCGHRVSPPAPWSLLPADRYDWRENIDHAIAEMPHAPDCPVTLARALRAVVATSTEHE